MLNPEADSAAIRTHHRGLLAHLALRIAASFTGHTDSLGVAASKPASTF